MSDGVNDKMMKAIEDIQTGKVEEQVIWQKDVPADEGHLYWVRDEAKGEPHLTIAWLTEAEFQKVLQKQDGNPDWTACGPVEPEGFTEKDLADIQKMRAEIEEPDPLEWSTQMGLIDEPVLHPLRAHDEENHENCWCNKKFPLFVHGHEVGIAVPLENGDYSMEFDDSNAGRLVKTLIDMGTENSFSIQNDQAILDLGEED
jgi:hypothetical protein